MVSVVIPAKNEEKTIAAIILSSKKSRYVNQVIVSIDRTTSDQTAKIAEEMGALVIQENVSGFGKVIKKGIEHSNNNLVFKTDGDIRQFQSDWIDRAVQQYDKNIGLVKTFWPQKKHTRSVTALTAKPVINKLCPELSFIHLPLSGIYLFDKNKVDWKDLSEDWGFDLHLLLNVYFKGFKIKQFIIPEIVDTKKNIKDLVPMAQEIVNLLFSLFSLPSKNAKILIITAHPDDAEIWCGGTIAQTCLNGGEVKSIIVTGTNKRIKESISTSKLIPSFEPIFLNQNQFEDFIKIEISDKISDVIHNFQPEIIITHQPEDFHIDHRRVSELTLMSLLRLGHKNYPNRVYYCNTYFQKDRLSNSFSPDSFVDISNYFSLKKKLISMHKSQRITYYLDMIEAMDKMNGIKSGVEYAEAFLTCTTHLTNKAKKCL